MEISYRIRISAEPYSGSHTFHPDFIKTETLISSNSEQFILDTFDIYVNRLKNRVDIVFELEMLQQQLLYNLQYDAARELRRIVNKLTDQK